MTFPIFRGMAKATELTRSGKLQEATALIQSMMMSPGTDHVRTPGPADEGGTVIDGEYTRIDPKDPATTPKPKPKAASTRPRRAKSGMPRTSLAATLRKIAAGGMPGKGPLIGDKELPLPEGAEFLHLTHAGADGSRSYRLYIPANRRETPMPLIVMLHGCTQTPEDFAAGTGMNAVAEELGCLIAYPAQPSGANAQKCWNWYRPEDQGRGQGEPAMIAGMTEAIFRDHPADPSSCYVAGLSAGGAAAVLLATTYPDLFSAVGVHSGLPVGAAHDIPSAFSAMRSGTDGKPHKTGVPTIVFHGLADSTVHPKNGRAVMTQALQAMPELHPAVTKGVSDGGRQYTASAHLHPDGRSLAELWEVEGAGHAWSGGTGAGSYTDPKGPDASRQMVRFFLQHRKA